MSGKLFLVASPIGHLKDITERAIETLRAAAFIVCEDTRHSRILLGSYGISAETLSLPAYAEAQRSRAILRRVAEGETAALLTDAGTPAISDPGEFLVKEALLMGIEVVPIPGASALITALCASGLPTGRFHFLGFLPRQSSDRAAILDEVSALRATLVLYESPRRVVETLQSLLDALGDRSASVARELTKIHEEFIRGPLSYLIRHFEAGQPLGEFVVMVAGRIGEDRWNLGQVDQALRAGLGRGDKLKALAVEISGQAGWPSKDVYRLGLQLK